MPRANSSYLRLIHNIRLYIPGSGRTTMTSGTFATDFPKRHFDAMAMNDRTPAELKEL